MRGGNDVISFLASADREEHDSNPTLGSLLFIFFFFTKKKGTREEGMHENPETDLYGSESAVRETAGYCGLTDPRVEREKNLSRPCSYRHPVGGWFLPILPLGFIIIPFSSPFLLACLCIPSLLPPVFSRMPPATSFSLLFLFFFFLPPLFFLLLLLPSILKEERRCNFHTMPSRKIEKTVFAIFVSLNLCECR